MDLGPAANEVFDVPLDGRLVTRGKNPFGRMTPEDVYEARKEAEAQERVERFKDRATEMSRGPVRMRDISPGYDEQYADEIGETMYASDRLQALREQLVAARRRR